MTGESRCPSPAGGDAGHCALCGDEAVAARVMAMEPVGCTAVVNVDGATRRVALDLVDGVVAGDIVLVHQGFVIARMSDA